MEKTVNTYLEKNIPFALFRAPNQIARFIAQTSALQAENNIEESGFHFAPFSIGSQTGRGHMRLTETISVHSCRRTQTGKGIGPSKMTNHAK